MIIFDSVLREQDPTSAEQIGALSPAQQEAITILARLPAPDLMHNVRWDRVAILLKE